MSKIKVEIEADAVITLATDMTARAGSRLVIMGGALVAVLPPELPMLEHRLAKAAPKEPRGAPVPTYDTILEALRRHGPQNARWLGEVYFKLVAGSAARNIIKTRLKVMVDRGQVRKSTDRRFPTYAVAVKAPAPVDESPVE